MGETEGTVLFDSACAETKRAVPPLHARLKQKGPSPCFTEEIPPQNFPPQAGNVDMQGGEGDWGFPLKAFFPLKKSELDRPL